MSKRFLEAWRRWRARREPLTINSQILCAFVGVNMLMTVLFSSALYQRQKRLVISEADSTLRAVATLARETLPPDYHDRIKGPDAVSDAEFQRIVDRNNSLCVSLGLEYIWSLMEIDGRIVFTTATSPDKVTANRKHARFFEPHSNPELYAPTFASMQPIFKSSHDKWGHIRVCLIPSLDASGRKYLFGASFRLDDVDRQLQAVVRQAVGVGAALFAVSMVIGYGITRRITRPIKQLTSTIEGISEGREDLVAVERGSCEQVVLARQFNRMHRMLQEKIEELEAARSHLISLRRAERKQAAEVLTQSEERYRQLLDFAVDGILVGSHEGIIIEANECICSLFGLTRGDMIGKSIHEMPFTRESLLRTPFRYDLLHRGEIVVSEREILRSDGREIAVEMHTKQMADGTYQSMYRDITGRKKAELEIRQQQEQLSRQYELLTALLQNLAEGVFMVDAATGTPLVANQAACRTMGWDKMPTEEAQTLANRYTFLHASDRSPYPAEKLPLFAAMRGEATHVDDVLLCRPDGVEMPVEVFGMPVKDEQGRVWAGLVSFVDISERKKSHELLEKWNALLERRVAERTAEAELRLRQLRRLTERLIRVEESERQRIAAVLHEDVQQTLAAARLTLSAGVEVVRSPAALESLGRVDEMLAQSIRLTRTLVQEISVPAVNEGDLKAACDWIAEKMHAKFGLKVAVVSEAELEPVAANVYLCLFRATQELLFNVVKHAGVQEAEVTIWRMRPGSVSVAVRDRGRGLEHDLRGAAAPGTAGTGLYGIRERVEGLEGEMRVESVAGGGVTVVLTLPLDGGPGDGTDLPAPAFSAMIEA